MRLEFAAVQSPEEGALTSSCICLDRSSNCCLAFCRLFLSTWSCGVWARSSCNV